MAKGFANLNLKSLSFTKQLPFFVMLAVLSFDTRAEGEQNMDAHSDPVEAPSPAVAPAASVAVARKVPSNPELDFMKMVREIHAASGQELAGAVGVAPEASEATQADFLAMSARESNHYIGRAGRGVLNLIDSAADLRVLKAVWLKDSVNRETLLKSAVQEGKGKLAFELAVSAEAQRVASLPYENLLKLSRTYFNALRADPTRGNAEKLLKDYLVVMEAMAVKSGELQHLGSKDRALTAFAAAEQMSFLAGKTFGIHPVLLRPKRSERATGGVFVANSDMDVVGAGRAPAAVNEAYASALRNWLATGG